MSISAQFTMYPYVANHQGFYVLPDKGVKLFNKDSQQIILNAYQEKIHNIAKDEAKKLQDALNSMVESQRDNYQTLVNKFITKLDNGLLQELQELDGVVIRKGASFSLSAVQEYDSRIREIAQDYLGEKVKISDDLPVILSQLNGQLNTLRGDIFENILAYVLDNSVTIVNGKIKQTSEELLENFKNRLSEKSLKNFQTSYHSTKVQGAELKDSILITIGDKNYTVSGSKGKTDVAISTLSGDIAGISAKSYTSSRRIHLVTKANLAGLIAQWPIGEEEKNLALNAFTSKSQIARQYNLSKSIFLLQALMGSEGDDILSELFIINRNTEKNPFIVLSTYDLIFNNSFKGKFSSISALTPPRTEDSFYNFIRSTTISISTQQTISKLAASAGL